MTQVTIGGERLGAGKKMKAYLHNYERSTFDKSFVWRSTMASGTLVPFWTEVALPGDTWDVNLQCEVLTHPTIGPLFGSYKVQLDVFQIPIRLYQPQLHMNTLNVGRDMSKVLLPQLQMTHTQIKPNLSADNQQINPSCIFSYLGIRGLGFDTNGANQVVRRNFNAIPFLAYWSIYKQYYANKQEEVGAVIHKTLDPDPMALTGATITDGATGETFPVEIVPPATYNTIYGPNSTLLITATDIPDKLETHNLLIEIADNDSGLNARVIYLSEMYNNITPYPEAGVIQCTGYQYYGQLPEDGFITVGMLQVNQLTPPNILQEPEILFFDLNDIDTMRMKILQHDPANGPFFINENTPLRPYDLPFRSFVTPDLQDLWTKQYGQEGLAIKTYNSDLFNNWISTEWIDGADGISAITAIDTSSGNFQLDTLNLSQKVYNMLNRIAISGGTYDDWLDAVYTHKRTRSAEEPMYVGGLIKELVFQEVVSNSPGIDKTQGPQPLGTLAGRGKMNGQHKGGNIVIKVDEPSYIMGIVSLTPRIDYSQGNQWDTNLLTMNDFHKPALDAIGFQDLITDQMAWWDTRTDTTNPQIPINIYKSAGKQPAWINYMTNINVCRGNFAEQEQQMYMTLNRRYGASYDPLIGLEIKDLTTYIDPSKFNHIFADTSRDAQNFWTQIAVNAIARRKMSSKIIPNL